jgi:sulfur-oxidizing protein SoxA
MLFAPGLLASDAPRPSPLRSGIELASSDIRSMQKDDFANPGMLWVTRGEKLWNTPASTGGKACSACHAAAPAGMRGVATRYPAVDAQSGRLLNLEGRIDLCRSRHQKAEAYAHESEDRLALAAYVAHQSRGMPVEIVLDARNRPHFERGRSRYHERIGQMNLACTHCHDRNWGRTLLSQTISQGHGNAYPAYGSPELVELELYLAWRGTGLAVETPGVRR